MLEVWLAALLDSSLKGLALCLAAGAAALLLRRSSAAARHLVWRLAFAGLLALPLLATLLPAWRVPLPGLANAARVAAALPVGPSVAAITSEDPAPSREGTSPSPTFKLEKVDAEPRGWHLSWQAIAFGIWGLGAFAVLGSLGIALLRVGWQGRRARPIEDPAWTGLLRQIRAELGVGRPVALVAGGDRSMPMAWGWRRPVVLLPAGAEEWPEPRRRAVLLHELAHVARLDYPAQLAAEVVRALYWFNPLVWMAARKLRIESEHACDDRVLAAGAPASDYAGDLLEIARSLRALRAAAPAGLTMARPSQLAGRLLAVLDAHRDRRGVSRRFTLPAWLIAACVVLPLAALAPFAPHSSGHSRSVSHGDVNGVQTYQWSEDGHKIRIRTEGKVDLNEDWTGIVRLSRGAEMRIEEEMGGTTRRLDIEPGSDGRPVYTWKVDGTERPFDAAGRNWLQSMLLQFVRGTGYAADERVAMILKRQGPEGVFAEISRIPGDYVKAIYFKKLLAHRELGAPVVERALRQAGKEVKSDYELGQTLSAAAESQPLTESLSAAYAEAAGSIQSDYEQKQALTALVSRGRLTPATLAMVLRSAHGIESDYECAELLTAAAGKNRLDDPVAWRAYAEAADTIGGAYERHRALSAAVKTGSLSQDSLLGLIQSARGIHSDYERASLLVEIAGQYNLSGAPRDAYLEAARSIHSQYERQRAEAALVERSGR
jgi:beta-lactamase regulating signal transducer with metallopeptidase domain